MKSKAYWVKRAVEVETYLQSQADSIKDGVIKAYERAIKNVNNDIEKTFKAYISTDIPEKEARRLMSIADSDKQYEELLKLSDCLYKSVVMYPHSLAVVVTVPRLS